MTNLQNDNLLKHPLHQIFKRVCIYLYTYSIILMARKKNPDTICKKKKKKKKKNYTN